MNGSQKTILSFVHHILLVEKSTISRDPSYIPSLFPWTSDKEGRTIISSFGRFKHHQKWSAEPSIDVTVQKHEIVTKKLKSVRSTASQTDFLPLTSQPYYIYSSSDNSNNVEIQFSSSFRCDAECQHNPDEDAPIPVSAPSKCTFLVNLKSDRDYIAFFGLPENILNVVLGLMDSHLGSTSQGLTDKEKIILLLTKFKGNSTFTQLGTLFSIYRTTASASFRQALAALNSVARRYLHWPSKGIIWAWMPKVFKENLPNCRVIIDCTKVTITHSGDVEEEVLTYSDYKGRNTYKILIGIAPHGEVIFVSKAFGGRTTDSNSEWEWSTWSFRISRHCVSR